MAMFIVASASPARRSLLKEAGFRFKVIPSKVLEIKGRGRTLVQTVLENARRKAGAISRRHPNIWVLGADTMIEFEGRIYGKPKGPLEGIDKLLQMGGKTHLLATGVVLQRGNRVIRKVVQTRVTFHPLDRKLLTRVARAPQRFAGGYSIRKKDDPVVAHIQGSFTNVVGLPMETVVPLLRRLVRN